MPTGIRVIAAAFVGGVMLTAASTVGHAAPCVAGLLSGPDAVNSDWTADRPGLCRQILPADLPPPSESHVNKARVVPRPHSIRELKPLVPPGFTVRKFDESNVQ